MDIRDRHNDDLSDPWPFIYHMNTINVSTLVSWKSMALVVMVDNMTIWAYCGQISLCEKEIKKTTWVW